MRARERNTRIRKCYILAVGTLCYVSIRGGVPSILDITSTVRYFIGLSAYWLAVGTEVSCRWH